MCENGGYEKLKKKKHGEAIEEMEHADAVIERILYLEGIPNMQRLNPVRVGQDREYTYPCHQKRQERNQ